MSNVSKIFGSMVFNDIVMKERLPKNIYKSMKKCIEEGKDISLNDANVIANTMKEWAIEKGATHFTHWFHPMTGMTAEKHDSFIEKSENGVIMEFGGKELIKGEPDASSFPSGGLRDTFEARGYTSWDPTSYVFIKDNTLCIPSVFCSYTGESLDKKTPLLKSMEAINKQALRILKLFGDNDVTRVYTNVGPEQEYFLIDKELYEKRKDLIYCGRTLFGAKPPKGQELEDHYFGNIKPRVIKYMKELDKELWELGILAKSEHNEVAPSQHELAPIFTTTNIATDQNQLTMEIMKKKAIEHNLICLLHEKPFEGVNGSGKHNNWSISTNTGVNLLNPGDSPQDNEQFLLFLMAIIKAVDEYQDLLRISIASAGNDHRLGGNEAPPAIISIFLGDELRNILESIENGDKYINNNNLNVNIGIDLLPKFTRDNTDRNRTSPFAFTGNKFEFRMVGSSFSIASPNIFLNTIVAESLCEFANVLEQSDDFKKDLKIIIKETIKNHKRILFNGNNYSDDWVIEAKNRGLLNLKTTPEAIRHLIDDKNIELFSKHNVFTENEIYSRYEILLEKYCKTVNIEAITMIDMVKKDIIPSVGEYINKLLDIAIKKKSLQKNINYKVEEEIINNVSDIIYLTYIKVGELDEWISKLDNYTNIIDRSYVYKDVIIPIMDELRSLVDKLECIVDSKHWPYPTYGELLFSVN